jgi:predicted adenylyl cyclase CyaB
MGNNVEIKARVADLDALRRRVEPLAESGPHDLHQEDTFFPCADARLKLRKLGERTGELIWYQRDDRDGPKQSSYELVPTETPDLLRDVLARALGVRGIVRKHRQLYLVGRTRVHLDRVEGLGDFMELEVVLSPGETAEQGMAEAHQLMAALGVEQADLVTGAYMDLLEIG